MIRQPELRKKKPAAGKMGQRTKARCFAAFDFSFLNSGGAACVLALLFVVTVGLVGCVQPRKPLLTPPDPPIVWPAPPDQPRVRYLGELKGSDDLPHRPTFGEFWSQVLYGPEPPSKLVSPHAVAVDETGERVAIADTNGPCVHIFDLARQEYSRLDRAGSPPQALACPIGVAWVGQQLWLADARLPQVVIHSPSGRDQTIAGDVLQRPAGIAYCAENHRCYVVDAGAHAVLAFDPDGRLIERIGRNGAGPGQFNFPSHIACGPGGMLVVSDSLNFRVQVLNAEGEPLACFGQKGDAAGDLSLPKGVAVDPAGNIWVVDANFENVQAFTPQGGLLMAFGSEGHGPGQFWLPAGICIDRRGRMWVADTYNRRVQVFELLP